MSDFGHMRYVKASAFETDPEPGAGRFRVFIGMGFEDETPDWVHVDRRFETWELARDYLGDRLARWRGDGCYVCARTGAEELDRLSAATPGETFEAEVEGEDFVIVVDSGSRRAYILTSSVRSRRTA